MQEPQFREPVFYVPGESSIIDAAINRDGTLVGHYSGETLDEIRLRYPGAEIGEWDVVYAAAEESCKTEPVEITEARFLEMLNVLPPVRWVREGGAESFKMSERYYGSITGIYARIGKRYFNFSDVITLPHDEIIKRIRESTAFTNQSETVQ